MWGGGHRGARGEKTQNKRLKNKVLQEAAGWPCPQHVAPSRRQHAKERPRGVAHVLTMLQ